MQNGITNPLNTTPMQEFVLNPLDTIIKINATAPKREQILSSPALCQAYLGTMELLPAGRSIIDGLQKHRKDVKLTLVAPVRRDVLEVIADHFRIPYEGTRRAPGNPSTGAEALRQIKEWLDKHPVNKVSEPRYVWNSRTINKSNPGERRETQLPIH